MRFVFIYNNKKKKLLIHSNKSNFTRFLCSPHFKHKKARKRSSRIFEISSASMKKIQTEERNSTKIKRAKLKNMKVKFNITSMN